MNIQFVVCIIISQETTKDRQNTVPVTEEFVYFLIKFARHEKRVPGFHFLSLRGADVFSHSAPRVPVSSGCSAPSGSGRVPGWAGRAGLSPLSRGERKAQAEPGWQRAVLEAPLQQGCAAGTAQPPQPRSGADHGRGAELP